MSPKSLNMVVGLFLLAGVLTSTYADTDYSTRGSGRRVSTGEGMILKMLGLTEDANDAEIIPLLNDSSKRGWVCLLIRYRKIHSAIPDLLHIVNDPNIFPLGRVEAAKALCDLGNKEWIPVVKTFIVDPNSPIVCTPYVVNIAGLLARAGDYSHFELVAKDANDSKWWIRANAVKALSEFSHETHPVTDSATKLLSSIATFDPMPRLREEAIYSLQKIAKKKTSVTLKVTEALKANMNSSDKNLRSICRLLLKAREGQQSQQ